MVSQLAVVIITLFMFLGFVAWIGWMAYWMLGKFGLWKWATTKRLSRRFGKNYEFSKDAIDWCVDKIQKKWRYKDIRKFIGYEKNGSELHYTFLMLSKLTPIELSQITSERRLKNNGEQTTGRVKEEVSRSFPELPKETSDD
jgi:hypothetical protein